jgi:hypothetical protein
VVGTCNADPNYKKKTWINFEIGRSTCVLTC